MRINVKAQHRLTAGGCRILLVVAGAVDWAGGTTTTPESQPVWDSHQQVQAAGTQSYLAPLTREMP